MQKSKMPRVEWAFFCERAERDEGNFLNITKLLHTIQAIANPDIGINFDFVFGLDGEPLSKHRLELKVVRPSGHFKVLGPLEIQFNASGFFDGNVEMKGMPIAETGDYRMEFRFDGESTPSHVATLRVLPAHLDVSR
jgi:diacylglycerol kinase family enzyme